MECMGQLTVIHDVRLREFGTLFRVVMVPKGTPYFTAAESVGAAWKMLSKEYSKRKQSTGKKEHLWSNHLQLGRIVLETMYEDSNVEPAVKDSLKQWWKGADTANEDFLGQDVKIMKWRITKDGKHGVLEFKLTESLMEVEEELLRVMVEAGGEVKTGPASRGSWVRELETKLEGT